MDRRKAREKALQILFEIDFQDEGSRAAQIIEERFEIDKVKGKQQDFIKNSVMGTYDKIDQINSLLEKILEDWDISRLGKVERSVLRLAIFEFKYTDLAAGIIMNEAVELTKTFSTEEAAGFVNGVLAKYLDKLAELDGDADLLASPESNASLEIKDQARDEMKIENTIEIKENNGKKAKAKFKEF